MQQVASKITKFTDLEAWKSAHKLRLDVYKLTKKFPSDEQFGLTSQRAGSQINHRFNKINQSWQRSKIMSLPTAYCLLPATIHITEDLR